MFDCSAPSHHTKVFFVSVVGWATFGPARDADNRYGELRGLYVDPDRWEREVARFLLEHL